MQILFAFLKLFHAFGLLFSKLLEMGVSEGRLFKGPLLNRWSPLRIKNKWGVARDPQGCGSCQITLDLSAVWCIKALSHMLYLKHKPMLNEKYGIRQCLLPRYVFQKLVHFLWFAPRHLFHCKFETNRSNMSKNASNRVNVL